MNKLMMLLMLLLPNENDICLANTIYHESRSEPLYAQFAVARATVNRLYHDEYPDTLCKVIYQKGQYQWTRKISKNVNDYDRQSLIISKLVQFERYVIESINYVGISIKYPLNGAMFFSKGGFNNKRLKYIGKIGVHKFYKIKKKREVIDGRTNKFSYI